MSSTIPIIYIAYYTLQTPYAYEIKRLEKSLRRFNLPSDIKGIQSLGSWIKNTQYKAEFIQSMQLKHPAKALVYLDADAIVCQYPSLFNKLSCDFGAYLSPNKLTQTIELLSGTLYFAPTIKALELVEKWIEKNQTYPAYWDQITLQLAMQEIDHLSFEILPKSYSMIYDSHLPEEIPVIEHFQASRRLRPLIDQNK